MAPLSVRLPAPVLVRPPLPLTRPFRLRSAVPRMPRLPARLTVLARATAVLLSRVVPVAAFRAPLPRAVLEARIRPPALRAVGPA